MALACTSSIRPAVLTLNSFYKHTSPGNATPALLLRFHNPSSLLRPALSPGNTSILSVLWLSFGFSLRIISIGSQSPTDPLFKAHIAYTPDAIEVVNRSFTLVIIKSYCSVFLISSNPFDAFSAVHFNSSSLYLPDLYNAHLTLTTLALNPSNLKAVLVPALINRYIGACRHHSCHSIARILLPDKIRITK
jgi:hypothetical protein